MQALWIRLAPYREEITKRLETEFRYSFKLMGDYDVHDILAWDRCLDEKWGLKGKGYRIQTEDNNPNPIYTHNDSNDRLTACLCRLERILEHKEMQLRMKEAQIYELQNRNNGHKSGDDIVQLWKMMEV